MFQNFYGVCQFSAQRYFFSLVFFHRACWLLLCLVACSPISGWAVRVSVVVLPDCYSTSFIIDVFLLLWYPCGLAVTMDFRVTEKYTNYPPTFHGYLYVNRPNSFLSSENLCPSLPAKPYDPRWSEYIISDELNSLQSLLLLGERSDAYCPPSRRQNRFFCPLAFLCVFCLEYWNSGRLLILPLYEDLSYPKKFDCRYLFQQVSRATFFSNFRKLLDAKAIFFSVYRNDLEVFVVKVFCPISCGEYSIQFDWLKIKFSAFLDVANQISALSDLYLRSIYPRFVIRVL